MTHENIAGVTDPADLNIDTATSDDYEAVARAFGAAMMFEAQPSDVDKAQFEPDRTLIIRDADQIVAHTTTYTRDLSVPGGVVPAAHVTKVGVAATHRRRGLLSALMRRQLNDAHEAIAVLCPTEPGIYGRFGYAAASWQTEIDAQLRIVTPRSVPDPGSLKEVPADKAEAILAPLLRRYQAQRPGVSGRNSKNWATQLADPSDSRNGMTARHIIVHRNADGEPDGYVLWRGKLDRDSFGPAANLSVEQLVAVAPEAYRALWQYLLTMDLTRTVSYRHGAIDEPIRQLLVNPRGLGMRMRDGLWLRITDVKRALTQRRYSSDVDAVIAVSDDLLTHNNQRFRITGGSNGADCISTDAPADMSLTVSALAAAYLGGVSLTELALSGQVTAETPQVLSELSTAFGWPVAPASIEVF